MPEIAAPTATATATTAPSAPRRLELAPGTARHLELLADCLTASVYDESAWRLIEARRGEDRLAARGPIRRLRDAARAQIVRFLARRGLALVRREPFDAQRRREGRDWPLFGYTMVGRRRLDHLHDCVADVLVRGVPGDFLEAGVWRGGTTIWMRALLEAYGDETRRVWAADSFEGLPPSADEADGPDLSHVEHLAVSLDRVRASFERFGLLDDRVRFLPGWFRDTLADAPTGPLAILRLDGDLHSSTMDALTALYARVSPGGWIVVDDYFAWDGCRRAVTDFLADRGLDPVIQRIDWTGAAFQVPAA